MYCSWHEEKEKFTFLTNVKINWYQHVVGSVDHKHMFAIYLLWFSVKKDKIRLTSIYIGESNGIIRYITSC